MAVLWWVGNDWCLLLGVVGDGEDEVGELDLCDKAKEESLPGSPSESSIIPRPTGTAGDSNHTT